MGHHGSSPPSLCTAAPQHGLSTPCAVLHDVQLLNSESEYAGNRLANGARCKCALPLQREPVLAAERTGPPVHSFVPVGGLLYVQNARRDGVAAWMLAEATDRYLRWLDDDFKLVTSKHLSRDACAMDQVRVRNSWCKGPRVAMGPTHVRGVPCSWAHLQECLNDAISSTLIGRPLAPKISGQDLAEVRCARLCVLYTRGHQRNEPPPASSSVQSPATRLCRCARTLAAHSRRVMRRRCRATSRRRCSCPSTCGLRLGASRPRSSEAAR